MTNTATNLPKDLSILIVDSSEQDAITIGEMLSSNKNSNYELFYVNNFKEAKQLLKKEEIHLIFMNLTLPDSYGIFSFTKLFYLFSHIPIIVLTDIEDKSVGKDAVLKGAQDFLIKSQIDPKVLAKVVSYAIHRKRTEEKLRLSKERYHDLFYRSNDAIYISTKSGDFVDINRAGLKLFGYSVEDINSITVSDLYIYNEDRTKLTQKLEKDGEIFDYEVDLIKKDGKTVLNCILNSTVISNSKGEITGYQGFIKDITKRKKAEMALHQSLKDLDQANRDLQALNITLEQKVAERTKELMHEKEIVLGQNKEIRESINYAKRIQTSILPPHSKIKESFKNSFIYYAPKEVVSGDFYWFERRAQKSYFAVIDCTGHGIPGAFMSFIGYTQLNEIIIDNSCEKPHEILKELDRRVRHALKQNNNLPDKNKDGMELGLIVVNHKTKILEYTGSMRPLYYVKSDDLHVIKGEKFSIGGSSRHKKQFTTHQINIEEGDCFYLFTDGYPDQFGGERNKKFKTKNVGEMIKTMAHLPIENQEKIVETAIGEWRNDGPQIDDILFAGIKF